MPRPTSVTLLALAVFCLSAFRLLGVASGIQRYASLSRLPFSLPPAYLIVSHTVWAAAFAILAVGLWRLREWGRVGTLLASMLYLAQGWIERLLLSRSDYARETIPYALGLNVIGLALVWGILLRRKVKRSFERFVHP